MEAVHQRGKPAFQNFGSLVVTFGVMSKIDFADPEYYEISNGGKYWQVDKRE
jgi:hypothetical protein